MLFKIVGIILCSISLTVIVIYCNLLIFGYGVIEFIFSLLKCLEFYLFLPGIYLLKKR